MKLCGFIFLSLIAASPAFSQTVIMGHHIGEAVSEFLAAEPVLQGKVDSCRAAEPKPMTPEQIHSLSKQDAYALGQQVFVKNQLLPDTKYPMKWAPNRGQLEELARQGMVITIDKRMPDEIATCHGLLALIAPPSSSPVVLHSRPHTRPHPITWHFKNGSLFQIDIDFHGVSFADVATDLTAKTSSRPDENRETDTPNLYGATIHVSRKATWLTPELYALLEEEEGIVDGQMYLSIISRAEYNSWLREHPTKGTLD